MHPVCRLKSHESHSMEKFIIKFQADLEQINQRKRRRRVKCNCCSYLQINQPTCQITVSGLPLHLASNLIAKYLKMETNIGRSSIRNTLRCMNNQCRQMFIDTIWIIKVNKLRTFVVQKQGQMISTTARLLFAQTTI